MKNKIRQLREALGITQEQLMKTEKDFQTGQTHELRKSNK